MSKAQANGIELEYESFGNRDNPAVLLIMGLGAQMTVWPEALCRGLANAGFFVIRFDNRDIGRSTWLDQLETPDIGKLYAAAMAGEKISSPYTLSDMAADAAGLLDALEIARAHIVGGSMGGMIAQIFASTYPERTLSLTSIMSTSARRELPQATPEAMEMLLPAPEDPDSRESVIRHDIQALKVFGGTGCPPSDERAREQAERAYDRGYHPAGMTRQFAALIANGNTVRHLQSIRVPSLVIHGDSDPLIPPAGGEDTAALIPDARLLLIPGMGHDLAPEVVPELVEAISRHCAAAGPGAGHPS